MQRILLTVCIVFICRGCVFAQGDGCPELIMQAEYRHDAIDWSGNKKHFIRDKVFFGLLKETEMGMTHVYLEEENINRHTWNFRTGDIIAAAEITAGHYYSHFGRGLLVGKQTWYTQDPYAGWRVFHADRAFSMNRSGNPACSLYGMAVSLRFRGNSFVFDIAPFYSRRERFIDFCDAEEKRVDTTINTLMQKTEKDYGRDEPVYMTDAGMVCTLVVRKYVTIQLYGIYSCITDDNDRFLAWGWPGPASEPGYMQHYSGSGLYLQYCDDYIRLFVESVFPCYWSSQGSFHYDWGCLYGIELRTTWFDCFFNGKNTSYGFYAPHGIYSTLSGSMWLTGLSVALFRKSSMELRCSSEKNSRPGPADSVPRSLVREEILYEMEYAKHNEIEISGVHVQRDRGGTDEEVYQGRIKSTIILNSISRLILAGKYQNSNSRSAGFASGSFCVSLGNLAKLRFIYVFAAIENNENIYYRMLPSPDTVSPGMFINETSHLAGARCSIRYRDLQFYAKYWFHAADLSVLSHHYEFYLEYKL